MSVKRWIWSGFLLSTLLSCAEGNCRQNREKATTPDVQAQKEVVDPVLGTDAKVKVFQYNGSQQCGQGQVVSLADTQKGLGDIQVLGAETKRDHLMHPQYCGASTGIANVFLILRKDLPKAVQAGFKEWLWE